MLLFFTLIIGIKKENTNSKGIKRDITVKIMIDPFCKICGAELSYSEIFRKICDKCFNSIPMVDLKNVCNKCGLPNSKEFCLFCYTNKLNVDRNISLYEYKDFMKDLIYRIKFYNDPTGMEIIKELLNNLNIDDLFNDKIDFIVPVPTSFKSLLERGFDFVYTVFKHLADKNNKKIIKIIGRKVFSKSQKKLSRDERIKLSKSQFFVKRKVNLDDKVVLLVDDVFTTGSTINVCNSLIRDLGAIKVYSLTIVRALEDM